MGDKKKWTWEVSDLFLLLLMVLSFMLFLIALVTELKAWFVLSDMTLMIIVMVTVSVIPALGKLFYSWMMAEKEEDAQTRNLLRTRRTRGFIVGAVFLIVALSTRLGFLYFGR